MRPTFVTLIVTAMAAAICGNRVDVPSVGLGTTMSSPLPLLGPCQLTFEAFVSKYHKEYTSLAEQAYRGLVFRANLNELNHHNADPLRQYNMKPNAFLDLTKDEFRSVYNTAYAPDEHSKTLSLDIISHIAHPSAHSHHSSALSNNSSEPQHSEQSPLYDQTTPEGLTGGKLQLQEQNGIPRRLQAMRLGEEGESELFVDWTVFAGPVRFQGFCGACYAFTTVDTVSSHLAIHSLGFFFSLSVQQVIDCADNGLTYGCFGGYLEGALAHIQMHGLVSETAYPFTSGSKGFSGKCRVSSGSFRVRSFEPIRAGSCSLVADSLMRGPVSAGISGYRLRLYGEGVFNECVETDRLDHAVVIVGFDSRLGWRIKNSWGTDWGEQGFGWIAPGNTCGICNMTVAINI